MPSSKGELRIHGASTAKIDLIAEWEDPVSEQAPTRRAGLHPDPLPTEIPLPDLNGGYLMVGTGKNAFAPSASIIPPTT